MNRILPTSYLLVLGPGGLVWVCRCHAEISVHEADAQKDSGLQGHRMHKVPSLSLPANRCLKLLGARELLGTVRNS